MSAWLVAILVALVFGQRYRPLTLAPLGALAGWVWGGVVTVIPAVLLAVIIPPALVKWQRNRGLRQTLSATERCLESMLEMSALTLQPDDILAAGGDQAQFLLYSPNAPHWLQTSLRHLFTADSVQSGLSHQRPLLILLQEVEQRTTLANQWRSEQAALGVATGLFFAVEMVLVAMVLSSPSSLGLFQTGVGRWLSAWVLFTTASMLAAPWFQPESLLW